MSQRSGTVTSGLLAWIEQEALLTRPVALDRAAKLVLGEKGHDFTHGSALAGPPMLTISSQTDGKLIE